MQFSVILNYWAIGAPLGNSMATVAGFNVRWPRHLILLINIHYRNWPLRMKTCEGTCN
ncbi:hypothetical protein BC939DRAFT_462089 [Gamsiella multidivaricata]|uniref:uncharacterized protein n=1 Tax=Gamsiella multidivaricata TaxID=101098 RepID=UPI002220EF9C|nr:uncharacterized protein BC939DRAFT_462089 [Gamsiella multidivaricata]KAI7818822.1 hypothetical protein BC939DRAFT_462089 [Gamsiella multidivaricata]